MRLDSGGPLHRNAQPYRSAFASARPMAAAVLGTAVIALVIGESLLRRVIPSRPALLTVGLLAGTLAVSTVWTAPTGAFSTSVPARAAEPASGATVPSPGPALDAGRQVARSIARPTAEPLVVTTIPDPPTVVRFRPRDGWSGVSRFAAVSVRFSRPMDHASTEAAFTVFIDEWPVRGTARWAEGDTVLVLVPSRALPYGAEVTLAVETGARAKDGASVAGARSVRFTVVRRPPVSTTVRVTEQPSRPVRPFRGWRWPLIGPITQRFGETLTQYGYHYGIDIDGQTGDPVRAARRGRVVVAGHYDQCGGLEVHIDHGDGFTSWYRHLSRIAVATGSFVEAGTMIGRVGDTGCSLGSHLHFAIRKDGRFVDPLDYLPSR